MFSAILVADRGGIAVRAFRSLCELSARTGAVHPHEDRTPMQRLKAASRRRAVLTRFTRAAASSPRTRAGVRGGGGDRLHQTAGRVFEIGGDGVTAEEHATAAGVPVLLRCR